jgi:hypothetical protein
MIFVHGHYQCSVCNTNALPCCDGDNCGNYFFVAAEKEKSTNNEAVKQSVSNDKDAHRSITIAGAL